MEKNTVCLPIERYDELSRSEEELNSFEAIAIFEGDIWDDPFAGLFKIRRFVLSKNEAVDAMAKAVRTQGEIINELRAQIDRPIRVNNSLSARLVFLFTGRLDIEDPKDPQPEPEEEIREQVGVQCITCENVTPMMLTKEEQSKPVEFMCPVCSVNPEWNRTKDFGKVVY